jgi:hypothetical protein
VDKSRSEGWRETAVYKWISNCYGIGPVVPLGPRSFDSISDFRSPIVHLCRNSSCQELLFYTLPGQV